MVEKNYIRLKKMNLFRLLIAFLFFIPMVSFSQSMVKEMKQKNYGVYSGEIGGYNYLLDTLTVQVESAPIEITVDKSNISITIGKINKKGSYHVLFKGSDYYVLDAFFEGDVLTERIVINEKTKSMIREGSYPQPNTTLKRIRKK
jgi:hypothetical protein